MGKFFISHLKPLLIISIIVLSLILLLTYISVQPALAPSWDYTKTGAIGDTFGGIAGTIVAYIAAIMAYCAFGAQYEANEVLKKSNELQQIRNSMSEHISLLSTIKLYDRENCGAGCTRFDSNDKIIYHETKIETLLREGAEALFALYQKFFILSFVKISQYEGKENKIEAVINAYLNFISERGYLFNYCLNHSLMILQNIDQASLLSNHEKEALVKEFINMLPDYELALMMLRFKLDKKAISAKEITVTKKYRVFDNLFPIIDPSHDQYIIDFNSFIESVPYLKT